jgi:hypothetical protein
MSAELDDWEARLRAELAEAEAALDGDEQEYAPAWKPQPGEALIGRVVRIEREVETRYAPADVFTIETRGGDRHAVWGTRTVLRNELRDADPKVGEHVAIEYLGLRESAAGTNYHAYRLAVDRPEKRGDLPVAEPVPVPPADDDIPF